MDIYRDTIIELYKTPLNKRRIEEADITHSGANVTCGDRVRIYLKLDKAGSEGVIGDASFEGEGCAISIAMASLLTEELKGVRVDEVLKWDQETLFDLLGTEVGATRIKCALLPLETIQKGLTGAA
ncbi:Fe-S cluster protein [Candidatus Peregrinibacteria bacterium CG_4_9_14_0_2_um_filter_53_11]|nr:MAG: Fe-S cluster protein [Candidatus Peregrinibacteria bacterium CG_4_9_14_0_2_um_filter_53_11]